MFLFLMIWMLVIGAFVCGVVLGVVTRPTEESGRATRYGEFEDVAPARGRSEAKYVTVHVLNRDKWAEFPKADGLDTERN